MKLEDLEQLAIMRRAAKQAPKRDLHWRHRPPMPPVNWKLVAGIAFGIIMWYMGVALLVP